MSIFFTKISDTFDNQKKEKDFVKEDNHYKDKTFFFDINDQNPKTNCFLSYNNEKNFNLLFSLYESIWIENWEKNFYNNCETFYMQNEDIESSYDILQKFSDLKNISKEDWKINWKNIIKKNKDKDHELVPKLFKKIFGEKLKQKYSDKSKFLKLIDKIIDYKSISQMNNKFKIFENKIDCTNIEQGHLGTCYFLAAISTISNYGQLLYQLFPQEKINPEGLYEICLYHKGRWVKVLVDDYFPFIKNTDTFLWAHPINNCLYTCFLEKAYAKINGSYNDINGGYLCPAFEALTGFESFLVKKKERTLSSEKIYEIKDEVYEYFYNKIRDGYLFSCATWTHAYSLIGLRKENNQFIFKVRNPWNCETSFNDGTFGLLSYNKAEYEKKFSQTAVCPVLFNTSIYFYDLSKIEKKYNYQFYFYFQTYKNAKITAGLTKIGLNESLSIKLKDMTPKEQNKKNEIILISFNEIKNKISELLKKFSSNDFNNYTDIGISKYLLKIDLSNVSKETLKNEKLKVIISGNINLKYLGYLPYEPNIDSNEIKIEYKKYNYGVKTGEIFENYKNTIKLLEEEFSVEMHPDAKGYYIETIFTDEVETIVRFDKAKLQNQICSYDKKENVYFTGNKHEEGKIVGLGKSVILKGNKYINIYKGEINKNKICCKLLNLDMLSGEATLKIPKITNFSEESVIESKIHKHKLKYTKAGVNWKCDNCLTTFGQNTYSFACRECNFNLCFKCMFDPNAQKKDLKNKIDDTVNLHQKRLEKLEKVVDLHKKRIEKFYEDKLKEKTISSGMYIIQLAHLQNKIIHLENNNLILWDMNNENKQKFNIEYDSFHKCYTIQNVENEQFLTCDDSIIYFTGKNNNINQQWYIPQNSLGYEIVLAKDKKLLQAEENAINGTRVSCQKKNGKSNQIFKFISTTKTNPQPKKEETIIPSNIVNYFPKPNWHPPYINQVSIVDALASVGYPCKQDYRLRIGNRNNIPGPPFSPEYNTYMLNLMKEGKLIIP